MLPVQTLAALPTSPAINTFSAWAPAGSVSSFTEIFSASKYPSAAVSFAGVEDPSAFDLSKDKTVALVQASVIAARHHMAIPSDLKPDILTVRDDEPDVGECDYEADSRQLCPRGDTSADRTIVVFGNSHARMWIPAFDEIGKAPQ